MIIWVYTWTPKVGKQMALMAIIMVLGLLFIYSYSLGRAFRDFRV